MGNKSDLDVAMIGRQLALDGGPVAVGFAMKILIPGPTPDLVHDLHPEMIGIDAQGARFRANLTPLSSAPTIVKLFEPLDAQAPVVASSLSK